MVAFFTFLYKQVLVLEKAGARFRKAHSRKKNL